MSMAHITIRRHVLFLSKTATGDHTNAQGLCLIGHVSLWIQRFRELATSLTSSTTQESIPCASTRLGGTVGLAQVAYVG